MANLNIIRNSNTFRIEAIQFKRNQVSRFKEILSECKIPRHRNFGSVKNLAASLYEINQSGENYKVKVDDRSVIQGQRVVSKALSGRGALLNSFLDKAGFVDFAKVETRFGRRTAYRTIAKQILEVADKNWLNYDNENAIAINVVDDPEKLEYVIADYRLVPATEIKVMTIDENDADQNLAQRIKEDSKIAAQILLLEILKNDSFEQAYTTAISLEEQSYIKEHANLSKKELGNKIDQLETQRSKQNSLKFG